MPHSMAHAQLKVPPVPASCSEQATVPLGCGIDAVQIASPPVGGVPIAIEVPHARVQYPPDALSMAQMFALPVQSAVFVQTFPRFVAAVDDGASGTTTDASG